RPWPLRIFARGHCRATGARSGLRPGMSPQRESAWRCCSTTLRIVVMTSTGTVRIGISGWTYAPWRGNFYPSRLLHADELSFASRQVDTIEINGTFYSLQRHDSFARWYGETPDGFIFAVKGPRFITHIRRLREIETPLANFFASGILRLEEKLGPVLW